MSRASRSSSSAISARYFFASSRARSLNAGDILSRRFLKFFAISCSCDSENTPIVVCQYPSSAGQTDHLLQAQSAHTTLDRQSCLRQSGESPSVKRHLVCKRWTIENADENSNGIPWFVLHRPHSDKLRFHLPSLH